MACKALGFHPLTWEMERRLRAGMVAFPVWTEELGRLIQASSIIDADEAQALVSMCRETMCVPPSHPPRRLCVRVPPPWLGQRLCACVWIYTAAVVEATSVCVSVVCCAPVTLTRPLM